MLNHDFRTVLKDKTSRYSLVTAVAKRARAINENADLKEKCGETKTVSYALNEFLDGSLEIKEPVDIENI